jgi:hypothetical protein
MKLSHRHRPDSAPFHPMDNAGRFVCLTLLLLAFAAPATAANLTHDPASGEPGKFAAEEIRREAVAKGITLGDDAHATRISITIEKDGPAAVQAYSLRVRNEDGKRSITVRGADAAGAMYGGLDVAEAIRTGRLDSLKDDDQKPHIAQRGIKFNIPLDLRTPSYSDMSDAGQANIPEVWERDFWVSYFDSMARHRYNVISLWSLHPFPSLVKVPEFPEVALNDVWRTKEPLDDSFSGLGHGYVRKDMLANHEVVKRMTIDEKIEFWRWVMQQAADRGIRVYFFTWNVFTYGAEGKHGITDDLGNSITKRYFRASVRETVKTYPLLAGIGITAGEGMPKSMNSKQKEAWLWDTYGEGVSDALKDQPGHPFNLIHRFHWASQDDILNAFKNYPGTFDLSFKYSGGHMYSTTKPTGINPLLEEMPQGQRTWLTVRNDDIYTFRFGDPGYVREYIQNMPPADKIAGFYMGPDGYTWGRDFLDRTPDAGKRQLVIDKQWYSFMLMGRLAYDPGLTDAHFEKLLAARHPKAPSNHLFRALQGAAQVYPLISSFIYKGNDYQWFPEASLSSPKYRGFYTISHFMDATPVSREKVMRIRDWRESVVENKPMKAATPLDVATSLERVATDTFTSLDPLREAAKADVELSKNVTDCEAQAWLGRYYASKIRAACALALFDINSDKSERETAIRHLDDALSHWKKHASVRDSHYVPALYNRLGHVDVTALTEKVAEDIGIARNWKPGSLDADGKNAKPKKESSE